MKFLLSLLLILTINIYNANSQSTLVLNGIIRDQTPSRNPDFQYTVNGVTQGAVKTDLGADDTPVYCCGDKGYNSIHNSTTFYSWFHDVSGINIPIQKNIVLTQSTRDPNIYVYENYTYFPIDGQGFDDARKYPNEAKYYDGKGVAHNFHFCMEIHTEFQYLSGETFLFKGDDDVWVFINKKLVVDLGGIHGIASNSINLDTLGLTVGENYPFDFFYCERHTTDSDLYIETSIKFECPQYDACGVCLGDNSTCCLPSNCEENNNLLLNCLQGSCDGNVCQISVRDCDDNNPCTVDSCVKGAGCSHSKTSCDDGNHCTVDYCLNIGSNPGCKHITIPNCVDCADKSCIALDKCSPRSCSPINGSCLTSTIDCDDENICTSDACYKGECVHINNFLCVGIISFNKCHCPEGWICIDPIAGTCHPGEPVTTTGVVGSGSNAESSSVEEPEPSSDESSYSSDNEETIDQATTEIYDTGVQTGIYSGSGLITNQITTDTDGVTTQVTSNHGHITHSHTTGEYPYHPCRPGHRNDCPDTFACRSRADGSHGCYPLCLTCKDIDCKSMNLKCTHIKNEYSSLFLDSDGECRDGACCRYHPTCVPRSYKRSKFYYPFDENDK